MMTARVGARPETASHVDGPSLLSLPSYRGPLWESPTESSRPSTRGIASAEAVVDTDERKLDAGCGCEFFMELRGFAG